MATPGSIILDITRTLSRSDGRGATGVDRVELAYIDHLTHGNRDVFFLTRLGKQAALLSAEGFADLRRQIAGAAPRLPLDRKAWREPLRNADRRWLDSTIRRLSMATGPAGRITPEGVTYLNVGHTHLACIPALAGRGRVVTLIHDMIPLDFPMYQTPASVARFADEMRAIAAHAPRLICNSDHTAERTRHWWANWGHRADITVAHLGIDPPRPAAALRKERAYVVQLGTIEPRKNHALTLDIWDHFAGSGPDLHIIGRRGWMIDEFARRMASPPPGVFEFNALDDDSVAAHLRGAAALLFPSHAEGFGLPLLEALNCGIPVIASDIPVFRELAGDHALYLDPCDVHTWADCIMRLASPFANPQESRVKPAQRHIPGWPDHFAIIDPLL